MRFFPTLLVVMAAFAGFATACHGQAAQQPAKTFAVPRNANTASLASLPDWTGIWTFDFPTPGGPPPEQPALTPASAAELKVLEAEEAKNEEPATESANCIPPGMPTIMSQPYDVEFLFTPGRVTIIQEAYMQVRRVFTDGRGHPADLDPTFNGHSIGHWEGDTLVVDTAGLGHKTPLGFNRLQHGPNLHVVERIRLTALRRSRGSNDLDRSRRAGETMAPRQDVHAPPGPGPAGIHLRGKQPQSNRPGRQGINHPPPLILARP